VGSFLETGLANVVLYREAHVFIRLRSDCELDITQSSGCAKSAQVYVSETGVCLLRLHGQCRKRVNTRARLSNIKLKVETMTTTLT